MTNGAHHAETCVISLGTTLVNILKEVGSSMSNRYSRARFGAAIVTAFLCGLVFASGFDLTHFGWAQQRVTSTKPAPAQIASAAETETAFEAVADHARPAVVSIEIEKFA